MNGWWTRFKAIATVVAILTGIVGWAMYVERSMANLRCDQMRFERDHYKDQIEEYKRLLRTLRE